MTEASVTQDLLAVLRPVFGQLRVLKTSERFTKGIPDVYIAAPHTWLEIKLLKPGDHLAGCSDALQRQTMLDYFEATKGRAWYVVYDARKPRDKWVEIYRPDQIQAAVNGSEAALEFQARGFNHKAVAEFVMRRAIATTSSEGARP